MGEHAHGEIKINLVAYLIISKHNIHININLNEEWAMAKLVNALDSKWTVSSVGRADDS